MTVRNTRAEQLRRAGLDPSKVKDEKPPKVKTEGEISHDIRTWLEKKLSAIAIRVNTGKIKMERGGWLHLAPEGTSDNINLLPLLLPPYGWIGVYLAVEVKRPGKRPTPEQARFIAKVNRRGGIGFYATSKEDTQAQLFAEVLRRFGPAALAALEKGWTDEHS